MGESSILSERMHGRELVVVLNGNLKSAVDIYMGIARPMLNRAGITFREVRTTDKGIMYLFTVPSQPVYPF